MPNKKSSPKITYEEARKHLDYDPETGELWWKVRKNGRQRDRPVGTVNSRGYLHVRFNERDYPVHRVIWLWWCGYFPENQIDHIDRDKLNNRLSNLREATSRCNNQNRGLSRKNVSGVKGVSWSTVNNKWIAWIRNEKRNKPLIGTSDLTEAVAHRLAAEQCLGWAGCDCNSSAYQYMKNYSKEVADETDKL